ncbi:ATP-binding protein [Rhodoferax antarcticus]|uniref:ATPase n=1 Tax=Rhodoferax antarcticus ANT.BR TaxID=1111071 RepID=A0A1Q8YHG1_9BURK|nr:ATP-binding protein [Rhodoferax antarcticus]APW45231.1 ATPase [Rhodoferax antarcticus]OLP07494.1 ATPase [Rhodoferax antarcticus ANT.BR]
MKPSIIPRAIEFAIREKLANMPAVVLLGPRQVGKTTLARAIAADWPGQSLYLDMERPADRRKLDDADSYLRAQQGKLVVIDEIHRVPQLFEVLRGIIDDWRAAGLRSGHFLLLGSAALDLMQQASETLAGRVAYLEVAPLTEGEVGNAAPPNTLWLRGGFPDSLLAATDTVSLDWRRDFIRSYLERDVPMFAPRLPAPAVGRLWTMLAHNQGELLAQSRLAQALGVSVPTVARYLDLLVSLQLVRSVQPWSCNAGKRLVKTPKTYVRDSGIVHALLALETLDDVLGHPVAGHSYEGMVLETLMQVAGPRYGAYFYRTQDGAEIDLVLARGNTPEIAVEVKRSSAPSPQKGFAIACDDLAITRRYVVYPGVEQFPLRHGAQAISLAGLVQLLMPNQPVALV